MKKFERVKAVVSLDAIAHNFAEMKKNIAEGTQIVRSASKTGLPTGTMPVDESQRRSNRRT